MDTEKKNTEETENQSGTGKVLTVSLSSLSPAPGSRHRKKIVGRGWGSGHGRHATRGMKGQRSRSGDGKMIGFEGGQMPLLRRIPKRGFTPPFPRVFSVLNVRDLNDLFEAGSEITPDILLTKGILRKEQPVKILGDGAVEKPLKVSAQSFSGRAKEKIIAAGGTVTVL